MESVDERQHRVIECRLIAREQLLIELAREFDLHDEAGVVCTCPSYTAHADEVQTTDGCNLTLSPGGIYPTQGEQAAL